MEKSPSPVYGARLELVYALIAHRGFESLLLRHVKDGKFFIRICRLFFGLSLISIPLSFYTHRINR